MVRAEALARVEGNIGASETGSKPDGSARNDLTGV